MTDVSLTGPPLCDALSQVSNDTLPGFDDLPEMHQDPLQLFTGDTKVLEVDDNLCNLG